MPKQQAAVRKSVPVSEAFMAIHHFYTEDGRDTLDAEGEPMIGFYYQRMVNEDTPDGEMTGPYPVRGDAEDAARQAWESGT
jgi:hypothetical protein